MMISPLLATALAATLALPSARHGQPLAHPRPAVASVADTAAIRAAVREAERRTGGTVGVHVRHLESGATFSARAGEPFFLASVCKLPIAVAVLREVERGRIRLDSVVRLDASRMMRGQSEWRRGVSAGSPVTVAQLLEAAVSDSDNTAANELLHLVGGPDAVTAALRRAGITGVNVNRDYTRLTPPTSPADARDTATPAAATELLAALWGGRLLAPRERAVLLGMMTNTRNPNRRIVAGVPGGTAVAHKTGTWERDGQPGMAALNDVGVVTLPDGGHLAVAVFVRDTRTGMEETEPAIAAIARAAYAHWAR